MPQENPGDNIPVLLPPKKLERWQVENIGDNWMRFGNLNMTEYNFEK